jgi:DAPG hydrolase PhiG domain
MIRYRPTEADRAALPATYATEPRYRGYRDADWAQPYAKYFRTDTLPLQPHVRDALLGGASPAEYGYDITDAVRMLSRPGYHKMETGWTRLGNGTIVVSCLTDMPGVTAEMWDWWLGWHSTQTARYKLWYPDAHLFTAVGDDRSADRSLSDKQRYLDNVSYIDEYIGRHLQRLAIRFTDPSRLGFDDPGPGGTVTCARTGLSTYPLAVGWLVHQVRPTAHGAEMRSRFFINHAELLDLPAWSLPTTGGRLLATRAARMMSAPVLARVGGLAIPKNFGYDMLFHCASEMNHLASFLPALYEEFKDTP